MAASPSGILYAKKNHAPSIVQPATVGQLSTPAKLSDRQALPTAPVMRPLIHKVSRAPLSPYRRQIRLNRPRKRHAPPAATRLCPRVELHETLPGSAGQRIPNTRTRHEQNVAIAIVAGVPESFGKTKRLGPCTIANMSRACFFSRVQHVGKDAHSSVGLLWISP